MARILIVEDEMSINELMVWNLQLVGHEVDAFFDGELALKAALGKRYDVVLLDIMLPGLSGIEVQRGLPEGTPVIFVTAKGNLEDRLRGLRLGADDYIVKPFEMLELVARVDALLRRTKRSQEVFELEGVAVDLAAHTAARGKVLIDLTPREYSLLEALVVNRNLALSRDKLLELGWGFDYEGDVRTVDVHIQRLRKKLGWEEQIQTVYKYGYRLCTG